MPGRGGLIRATTAPVRTLCTASGVPVSPKIVTANRDAGLVAALVGGWPCLAGPLGLADRSPSSACGTTTVPRMTAATTAAAASGPITRSDRPGLRRLPGGEITADCSSCRRTDSGRTVCAGLS